MTKQLRTHKLSTHIARALRARALSVPLSFPAAALMTFSSAFAGPTGGIVVTGQGTVSSPAVGSTVIDQASQQLHVNWNTFDVGASESVQFNQPSASAVALNRILDHNPSQIFGRIEANGQVILVNPNGLLFGHSAQLNVGSLVASSLDVIDFDAASGRYSFGASRTDPGAVLNEGLISASAGGSVTLLGGRVANSGAIIADFGAVNLAAGRAATLDLAGDGLLRLEVDADLLTNEAGAAAAVENSGEVQASGGRVLLTAQAMDGVFANLVNNTGVVRANRIDNSGGAIRLMGAGGTVRSSGVLDASAGDGLSSGGTVEVLGEQVGLFGDALVDVSGAAGGGTALIGGDYQGENPDVLNAARTYVGADAVIDADAGASGDGGRVIVWADEITRFGGHVSARGGALSGDGGFAEVSGKQHLVFRGGADLTAAQGATGTLLLDPTNITINDSAATDPDYDPDGVYDFDDDPGGTGDATVGNATIETLLATTDVVLQATNDITQEAGAAIDVSAVDAAEGRSLTLEAGNNITLNDAITTNNGAVMLTADSAASPGTGGDGAGAVTMQDGSSVNAGTATVTLNAAQDIRVTSVTTTGATSITSSGGAIVDDGDDSTRISAGSLTLNGATIGALANRLDSNATSLDATATAGGVFITELDALTLAASASAGAVVIETTDGALTASDVSGTGVTLVAGGDGSTLTLDGAVDGGTGDVSLTAGGAIVAGQGNQVSGATLNAQGLAIGTSDDRLNTTVASLDATSTNGGIFVTEANALNLTASATGGALDVQTTDGALTVTSASGAGVTLAAGGDDNGVTLSGAVTGGAGYVTLTAGSASDRGAISGAGQVSGAVFTAEASAIGADGARLNTDVATLNATSTAGGIYVREANALDLTASATGGPVDVLTTNGALTLISVEADDADITLAAGGTGNGVTLDGAVDAGEGDVRLTAVGAISGGGLISGDTLAANGSAIGTSGARLTTSVDSLNATSTAGGIFVAEADGLALSASASGEVNVTSTTGEIVARSITTSNAVTLTATAGSILDDGDDATVIGGGSVALNAATNIGTVVDFGAENDADVGSSIDVQTDGALIASVTSNTGQINLNITGAPDFGVGAVTLGGGVNRAGAVVLQSSADLNVAGLTAGAIDIGADNTTSVGLRSGGVLTLPAGGGFTDAPADRLLVRGATDVIDSDAEPRELAFAATALDFRSGAAGGATTLNTAVGQLDASIGGGQNLTVNESDALTLGALSTTGDIIITAGGAIADDSSDLTRISGAALTLSGVTLGADGDELDTQVNSLAATASAGGVYVREADGLTLTASASGSAVDVRTASGAMEVTSASGDGVSLTAGGAGSALTLNGAINGGSGDVSLNAGGAIVAGVGNQVAGAALTAAGSVIGAGDAFLNTAVDSLNATSTNGGIFIAETDGLTVSASAAGGPVDVQTTDGALAVTAAEGDGVTLTAGGSHAITLNGVVDAGAGDVALTAGGAIVGGAGNQVSGAGFSASGSAIGAEGARLNTSVDSLNAASTNGGIFVTEANGLHLTANATGGAVDVQTNNGALTVASASGSRVSLAADGALNVNGAVNSGGDDVSLSAGGALTLNGSVSAGAGDVMLSAGDAITAVVGAQVMGATLTATGSALGASGARLNTAVDALNATTTSGGIYVTEADALVLTADAAGAVDVQTTDGALSVGAVSGSSATLAAGGASNALTIAGSIDTGTGAANLTAGGAITDGAGGPSITAGALTLSGASIGSAANRLDARIASLTGVAAAGDVYIAEADGLTLANVSALGAGADVDVTSATGDIVVGSVSAIDTVTLSAATGAIVDDAVNATRIAANALTLHAGANIGAPGANAQIDTDVTSLTAAAGAGNVHIGELNGLMLASVTAAGAGSDVSVVSAAGDMVIGAVSAQDAVTLAATAGSIVDDGDDATRITANTLTLTAAGAIGAANALDGVDTDVTSLAAAAGNGGVFISEQDGLTLADVSASGADSDVIVISDSGDIVVGAVSAQNTVRLSAAVGSINDDDNEATRIAATALTLTAGGGIGADGANAPLDTQVGSLTATAADGGVHIRELDGLMLTNVSASGESNDVSVTSATGDIVVGAVSAPDAVTLTATAGSILDDGSNATHIAADSLTLTAGASIGAPGASNEIDTQATSLMATAAAGDVRIGELDGLTLTNVSAAGADSEVVVSAATGDIVSANLAAEGAVTLTALDGSILDDDNDATVITGGSVTLAAASNIGTVSDFAPVNDADIGSSVDVQTSGALSASVASNTGQIHLNVAGTPTLATGAIRLGTGAGRAGAVVLRSDGNLDLAGLSAGAIDIGEANTTSIALRSGGVLTLPSDSGFTDQPADRLLVIGATDVIAGAAGSREFAFAANTLDFRSGAAGGSTTLNTEVGRLDARIGNDQNLIVNESDALTLGAIGLGDGDFMLNAGGVIADDEDDLTRIVSHVATLTGAAIGASDGALDTQVNTLAATTTAGGVYISEADSLVLTANAVGTVEVQSDDGVLTIDAASGEGVRLTAGGSGAALVLNGVIDGGASQVVLTAGTSSEHGAIVAGADSRISGDSLTVLGSAIGATDARLNTDVASLNATSTDGGVFVAETDALALTANSAGLVDVQTDHGALAVNSVTGNGVTLTAGGAGSGIALNGIVSGGAGGVTLTAGTQAAGGAISAGAGGLVTGEALTMTGAAIGSAGAALRTDIGVLTASATLGGVHISEQNGLTLTDVGAAGGVTVSSATGDITVATVAGDAVALTAAAGAILDDGDDTTRISANALTLSARSLGAAPTELDSTMRLDTDVSTLTATATSGGVFIDELNDLDIVNVQASGGAVGDVELLSRSGDLNLRNVSASDTLLLAAGRNIYVVQGGNPITARVAELRAGAADPEGGRIGTLAHPLDLHLNAGDSLRLFVPQSVRPDDPDRGPATLPSPGVKTTLNFFSSPDGAAVRAGFGQFEGFGETQFTSPAEVLLRTLQNQTGTVQAGLNIDWASFDPDVSLFGTLDPAVCLPGDQRDEEVTTGGC